MMAVQLFVVVVIVINDVIFIVNVAKIKFLWFL